MLKNVAVAKEVSVNVINKIGVLADMAKILTDNKVNIEAVAGYGKDNTNEAEIKMVTNDNVKATDVLKKNNYTAVREKDVLIVELTNKPGALKVITEKIAAGGLDIKYIYGTACSGGCPAKIVLSTTDDKKALSLLK